MANDEKRLTVVSFEVYRDDLFDLYRRFRYGEIIASSLMRGAARVEKAVMRSLLALVALTFSANVLTSIPALSFAFLNPLSAAVGAVATIIAVYAYMVGSNRKLFYWFSLSRKFKTAADEVEYFALYVRLGKIDEKELSETWNMFVKKLSELLGEGGPEYLEHEQKTRESLQAELGALLSFEGATAHIDNNSARVNS